MGSSISANSASISSLQVASSSFSTRITSLESFSSSLDTIYATDAELNAATASLSSSLGSSISANSASISTLDTTTVKLTGDQTIGGNKIFNGNISVNGTASFAFIQSVTGSSTSIGTAFILLNEDTPASNFAGIQVVDSGSTFTTASFIYDGLSNNWIFSKPGDSPDSGSSIAIFGPLNTGSLGSEVGLTENRIPKAVTDHGHHISDSNISDNGTTISLGSNTQVTGSLNISGGVTGSFTGSFKGDGSQLTGIVTDPFPYTGSAVISGSLAVTGNIGFSANLPLGARAWSSGGVLITARQSLAGAGTQNSGLGFGGCFSGAVCGCTEEYDGTSWTAGGALITARQLLAGAGTQNSGLAFGGRTVLTTPLSCTEEYDGTSWTAGGALIIARHSLAGAGTQNSGLAFGGASPAGVSCTEEYDGTSWSVSGALITGRCQLAGAGTQNQALAFGGVPTVSCTEEYNGTSWSSGGALITARQSLAGAGTQNAGLAFGGFVSPASVSCTEEYNGSSWSTGGALITARFCLAGEGEQNTALAFGGSTPSQVSCTEEYTGAPVLTKTFDYSSTTGLSATGSFTGSFVGDGSNLTGLPPGYSVTNSSDNRVITSVDSTSGNAEANLTFNGTVLNITGNVTASGGFNGNLSGNASTSTILQTARTIGGVSFDGSANINLPGVNTAGNQDTSGTATNATNFNVEADDSTNAAHFIIFTGGATGNQRPNSDSALTYNPSTNLLSAGCFVETSALRCKDNIHPISSPLDKVKQLKPVTFDWKHSGKNDIGFIAEEVKEVLPNLIHYNEEGEVEGMNYSKVTSLLVAAIQEQQEQINELKQEINNLKNK